MISNGKEIQTLGVLILCVSKWLMAISVISRVRQEPIALHTTSHVWQKLHNQGRKRGGNLLPNFQTEFDCQLEQRCLIQKPLSTLFYPVATKMPRSLHSKLGGFTEDVYIRATYKDQFKKATIKRPALRGIIVASQVKIAFSYAKEDAGIGPIYTIQI